MSQQAPRQRAFPLLSCGQGHACVARAGHAGLAELAPCGPAPGGEGPPDKGLSPSVMVIAPPCVCVLLIYNKGLDVLTLCVILETLV